MSKRDDDLNRRQGKKSNPRNKYIALALAAAIVVGIIIFAATRSEPDTREANFAAFGLADDPFLGNQDAPVVLVGLESPWCSSCKVFHEQILPKLQPLIDDGSLVFVYSQNTWGHQDDLEASMAQECAFRHGGNDAFWDFTGGLYKVSQNQFYSTGRDYDSRLQQTASATGMDAEAAISCLNNKGTEAQVRDDWRTARDYVESGTPRFLLFGLEGTASSPDMNQVERAVQDLVAKWT